jgi:lysophospholipase L1-like esterase
MAMMKKRNIFVIGDSISVHYSSHLKALLNGRMEFGRVAGTRPAAQTEEPLGGNGGDSRQVLAFLLDEQSRGVRYDILLVNCGLHDIKVFPANPTTNVPRAEYEENLKKIIQVARALAEDVLWVRTTPVEDDRHNSRSAQFKRYHADEVAYNQIADTVMGGLGVPAIDLNLFTRNLGPDVWMDHVHYTDHPRALQAAFIAGHLFNRANLE